MENDLATDATPSFTCSMMLGFSSAWAVVVVVGAGSPANLRILLVRKLLKLVEIGTRYLLIRHHDQKSLSCIFICL